MKPMNRSFLLSLLIAGAVFFYFTGALYAADASPYGLFTKEQYFMAKRIPPEKKAKPQYGGVFRLADTRKPATLDPADLKEAQKIFMGTQVFNGLIAVVPGTLDEFYPDLAERWEESADKTVYTFYIRKGVKFHNGREMTVDDVLYSLNRLKNDKRLFNSYRYRDVQSIEAIDTYTVRITLNKFNNAFLMLISGVPGSGVVPKEMVEKYGKKFGMLPEATIGTGPYMLKEWNSGKDVKLKVNPDYFRGGRAYPDEIHCYTMSSAAGRILEFESGRLELTYLYNPDNKKFMNDPKWRPYVQDSVYAGLRWYGFNPSIKPFDNKTLRKALAYAFDRERDIRVAQAGLGEVAHSPIYKAFDGYDPNFKPYPFNPEKAKQLLKEAGYPNGIDLTVTIWNYRPTKQSTEFFQAQLEELGIRMKIETMEMGAFRSEVGKGKFGMYGTGRAIKVQESTAWLTQMFHSKSKGKTGNYGYYENKDVDKYLDLASGELDKAKRIEYIKKANELIMDDVIWITEMWGHAAKATQPWVHGAEGIIQNDASQYTHVNLYDNQIWVEKDKQVF